ncbi:hypothetical protein GCM10020256_26870 [Streptomyces thermocoprophilus]
MPAVPVDDDGGLLGLADLQPVPQPYGPFGAAYGDDVGRGDEERPVGQLDGGGTGAAELGAAVDDDDLVP